jgi:hypothetical protein
VRANGLLLGRYLRRFPNENGQMLRNPLSTSDLRLRYVVRIPVAVEKLALHEIAEIASRQEALQTIFPSLPDIFYHPIFDYYQKNRLFQQPPLFSTVNRAGTQTPG